MRSHAATHEKARPFDCGVCGKTFSRKSGLKKHEKQVHSGGDGGMQVNCMQLGAGSVGVPSFLVNGGVNPSFYQFVGL